MDYSKHLFRASSFGNLMTGAQGLTDAQHKEDAGDEIHDEVADIIKEDLWSNPLTYFNNDADEEDFDGDDDGDEEGEEDDDDEEEEDGEE